MEARFPVGQGSCRNEAQPMSIDQTIARLINLTPKSVSAVIKLLDGGDTIPFIARYRKEATGGLDEIQLRRIREELSRLRALAERRETILKTIREQDKLTPELEQAVREADTRTALEDLYQPFKPRRVTRADQARRRGLQGLGELILTQPVDGLHPQEEVRSYLSEEVETPAEAWQGARDIAAEKISEHPGVRGQIRGKAQLHADLISSKKADAEDPREVYRTYYQFKSRVDRLQSHQVLALNRGEEEGILKISLEIPERDWRRAVAAHFPIDPSSAYADHLRQAGEDAAARLLLPAIVRDVRRSLTEKAEEEAIAVFASNLRALLLQPPLAGQTVLGMDPGFRTGCKTAVVDPTGKVLDTATIYPAPPRSDLERARKVLDRLIQTHEVSLIAIGNGTASRETELFVADLIGRYEQLSYLIVSEAGASVYSASELAGRELPELDVSLRGAVSIARRVQDPLAELVKIDPRSIGVGMYQHDVNQKRLNQKLEEVVESVVNQVGVDLNTASPVLLTHVSGIGPALGDRIVEHRDGQGPFCSRRELLDVQGLGAKTYQLAAGFVRVPGGTEPLDDTAIHPESYPAARQVLRLAGIEAGDPPDQKRKALQQLSRKKTAQTLAAELHIGVPTLVDIFQQLAAPGRDPREDLPKPVLRRDVLKMEDLVEGLELQGTVRNVVAFGAFIDIGVKQDGLLHRSQIPKGAAIQVGDVLPVRVLNVDPERGRIGLGWTAG